MVGRAPEGDPSPGRDGSPQILLSDWAPDGSPQILLSDWAPRAEVILPASDASSPRFPVIDAHNHLGREFGGGWAERPLVELLDVMDEAGVECLVDLDGGWGEAILDERLAKFKEASPDRFAFFAGIDPSAWPEIGARFGEWAADRLIAQVLRGAQGLKVWKALGMRVRDERGERVPVDDPRLDPVWLAAAERRIPVTIHVGDPAAFFRPLDCRNERYELLRRHPDWHVPVPRHPSLEQLLGELSRLVARHPATTFIGAHVGCHAEDLAWVGAMLDRNANFHVDIAARLDELGRQPYTARRFFLRYADRILFGADHPPHVPTYRLFYRFLQSSDEYFAGPDGDQPGISWRIHGLFLPEEVLRRIYRENATAVLGL